MKINRGKINCEEYYFDNEEDFQRIVAKNNEEIQKEINRDIIKKGIFYGIRSWLVNSKYGKLICLVLAVLLIGTLLRYSHFILYSGELRPSEYTMTGYDKNEDGDVKYIEIKYNKLGKTYEAKVDIPFKLIGFNQDSIIENYETENYPDITPEEMMGILHYNILNPKKLSTYR